MCFIDNIGVGPKSICSGYTSIVSRHLATRSNNKIRCTPSPHISSAEEILPCITHHTLAPKSMPNHIHHHYASFLISVCIFIMLKDLLISSATVIVHAGGAIWLNPFAMVLFNVCSAVTVECCVGVFAVRKKFLHQCV